MLATTVSERIMALDSLLFDVCESLQLSPTQHKKAVDRYKAISSVLNSTESPFSFIETNLYSQGSMRLGTTVKPLIGPHDLDFVFELAIPFVNADPIDLLDKMFGFFKKHGVYQDMVERKNRCVRIIYRDEFYMDILPACRDHSYGGSCVQVPDRERDGWKASNPIGFAKWFEERTRQITVTKFSSFSESYRAMDKAASVQPIPTIEATEDKTVLQLVVQLLKCWRDIHYSDSSYPPISVVLTTLAADTYQGEEFLCDALLSVLQRIVRRLDAARAMNRRLEVLNPVHREEDFSERWKDNPRAYNEFEAGIRSLTTAWSQICSSPGNVDRALEGLFGGVINFALVKQARSLQASRERNQLGIRSLGVIASVATAVTPMRRNTNDGR